MLPMQVATIPKVLAEPHAYPRCLPFPYHGRDDLNFSLDSHPVPDFGRSQRTRALGILVHGDWRHRLDRPTDREFESPFIDVDIVEAEADLAFDRQTPYATSVACDRHIYISTAKETFNTG